jgi:glycosyltransferase involved in cell wall biosynthesis
MHVSLITLGDPGKLTGGYLYHRRLASAALDNDAALFFVPLQERPFPLAILGGRRALVRAADADVMVLDSIAAAYIAPWLLSPRRRPPMIAMLHQPPGGIDHRRFRKVLQSGLDRLAYRRAAHLIVASETLIHDLTNAGFDADSITVIAPGRDVAANEESPGFDLRLGRRAALLCVGNWIERKGILTLLEALRRLPAVLATLHLVGDPAADPSYGRRVRAVLSHPDLSERVVVHGPLSKERVAGMYANADVFVLPSTREPYGTVLGEAMAAGLPVVGVNAGNLPHLATNGMEGLIVPVEDIDALAHALECLCRDERMRATMGEAAARRATSFPTWEASAERFFGLLQRVIERSTPEES